MAYLVGSSVVYLVVQRSVLENHSKTENFFSMFGSNDLNFETEQLLESDWDLTQKIRETTLVLFFPRVPVSTILALCNSKKAHSRPLIESTQEWFSFFAGKKVSFGLNFAQWRLRKKKNYDHLFQEYGFFYETLNNFLAVTSTVWVCENYSEFCQISHILETDHYS